jgi:hypothetical protein
MLLSRRWLSARRFWGVDEVLELGGIPYEEDRRVIADHVVVAVLGVELQREASRVADGVRRPMLQGDCREAGHHIGPRPLLEQRRLRELADILGRLEKPERPPPLA